MRGNWRGLASFLPVGLLISVALHQLAATVYGDLSPWLGGGFGMFATLDSPGNRAASAHVVDPAFRREVHIPADLEDATDRTVAFPTDSRMTALAERLATRYANDETESIELTVWRIRPSPTPLRTVSVHVDR
jgi:hypothetical protein